MILTVDLASVALCVDNVYYIQFLINHYHGINDTRIQAAISTSLFHVEINKCLGNYLAEFQYSQPNGWVYSWFAVRFAVTISVIVKDVGLSLFPYRHPGY